MTTAEPSVPPTLHHTPVLIVGAGPVGSVLALELAGHGVASIVIDRSIAPPRHPKMDYLNGRSMELLRRLDVTADIRARGISAEHQANFTWTLGRGDPPVAIWRHPSVTELSARAAQVNDGTVPTEFYQRVQGSLLEELVRSRAREHPLIDMREGCTFAGLNHHGDGVAVTVVDGATKTWHVINAESVVGCDGARSSVRQAVGIELDTSGPPTRHLSVYFRSSDPALRAHSRSFVTISARGLTLVSRDENDTWTGSIPQLDDEQFSEDPVSVMQERLGIAFDVDEVLNITQWDGSLSVATAYRRGRVFLVGDSAHSFYPTGGHGANTGLAEAVDLGWKLAAIANGWGGPGLLDSYEAERRPVALFNRQMCANLLEVWRRFGQLAREGTASQFLAGFLAEETYQLNNLGIHFGYRYETSPIISHDGGEAPPWRWREIVPTSWPGGRPPSLRLAGGGALFDEFGPEFTLVDLSGTHKGEEMAKEAADLGVPITHLVIDEEAVRACWERDLVLIRPDQHVAWRGNEPPDDWAAVLDLVSGN